MYIARPFSRGGVDAKAVFWALSGAGRGHTTSEPPARTHLWVSAAREEGKRGHCKYLRREMWVGEMKVGLVNWRNEEVEFGGICGITGVFDADMLLRRRCSVECVFL